MNEKTLPIGRLSLILAAIAVAAVMAALLAATPATAQAATYTPGSAKSLVADNAQGQQLETCAATKTVKKASFETSVAKVNKKATTVKAGTVKLRLKGGSGYIKFTATKTKTYKFTFSKLNFKSTPIAYASFLTIDEFDSKSITHTNVSTKGGKTPTLWLTDSKSKSAFADEKLSRRPLDSRTATVKLKKGQTAFFYINGSGDFTTQFKAA